MTFVSNHVIGCHGINNTNGGLTVTLIYSPWTEMRMHIVNFFIIVFKY
jgi:hypothetical protein